MREGELGVYTGASRQGKTAALKQKIKTHRRVIVWSVKESLDRYNLVWRNTALLTTLDGLYKTIRSIRHRNDHIVYVPTRMSEFNTWCELAFLWGQMGPTSVVAEELADVTSPGKAPDAWGVLVRQGLGYGISVYAITQRPAESDKTVMGNATYFHAHYMARANDRKFMAMEMDIPLNKLAALKQLEWFERYNDGRILKGTVKFK